MTTLRSVRRASYKLGRVLGDVDAVLHPRKLPRRVINKIIGRKVVRRLWR